MSYLVPEISNNVYAVGVKDWDLRVFDALIPLAQGTTYNSYLVKGSQKTALIDTVRPGFEKELEGKIAQITDLASLDYLIMNHAEPDHSGSIPYFLKACPKARFIASEKGIKMAQVQYGVPVDRIQAVKDGDTLSLGDKTLKFLEAPWLHWPETMFTYLPENQVLFPCDFFGSHNTSGIYAEEVEDIIPSAKRYFGEIMMPFRNMGQKALDKIKTLDIKMIAPSHGPVYRNPSLIMEPYRKWVAGETRLKAVAAYVSMWHSTESMIKALAEILLGKGIEVVFYDLVHADIGELAKDLVDTRAMIFGSPTVLGGMHPVALYGAYLVKLLKPPVKYAAMVSSYGWSGAAVKQAMEILGPTKIDVVGKLEINGPPTPDDFNKIQEIGKLLSDKILAGG